MSPPPSTLDVVHTALQTLQRRVDVFAVPSGAVASPGQLGETDARLVGCVVQFSVFVVREPERDSLTHVYNRKQSSEIVNVGSSRKSVRSVLPNRIPDNVLVRWADCLSVARATLFEFQFGWLPDTRGPDFPPVRQLVYTSILANKFIRKSHNQDSEDGTN